jgi:ADP-ribosyl-[dinitrogen reductase] hydrolase
MLGTIIGDIVGSVYEFKNCRTKEFAPFFHPEARYTDDTVCTIAVADALASGQNPQDKLQQWCQRYADNGGWGQKFALWIFEDNPKPYGSWGNGAAMRIAPVGMLAESEEQALEWSDTVTNITHNHPDALDSARAVALAIHWARKKVDPSEISRRVQARFGYDMTRTPDQIRPHYVRTEKASDSVPQAMVCALQASSFEDSIRNAVSIGGDSDTIAAIAGGIAEALFGLPDDLAAIGWSYLPPDMKVVLVDFYSQVPF